MDNLFSVFDYTLEESRELIEKITSIHNDQKLRGFFSNIGMSSGDYLNFQMPDNLVVVGDLHGDFTSLKKIMNKINYEDYLKTESNILIFLGDYIDRGKYSMEVMLLLCGIKTSFPNNMFMLRGNHEAYHRFPFSAFDFLRDLQNKFDDSGETLYTNTMVPFFDSLFGICEINGFSLLVHGGLPVVEDMEFFRNYKFRLSDMKSDDGLLEEILWNDPREFTDRDWQASNRGLGKYFGINITKNWLNHTNTKLIIRGHEPCMGYKINHDNKVMTLFSSKEPYPKFESSYLEISKKQMEALDLTLDLKEFVHGI
ncbi:MAG: serine/threonine protein phosphatase [Thermoproteota archaeon]|nr:serine/threonine protein phosphatase [Thermoproteota archaeon]